MRLEDRAARIGRARAETLAARMAEAAGALAGVRAEQGGAEVTLTGRGLLRRRLDEPLLRVPGALP